MDAACHRKRGKKRGRTGKENAKGKGIMRIDQGGAVRRGGEVLDFSCATNPASTSLMGGRICRGIRGTKPLYLLQRVA